MHIYLKRAAWSVGAVVAAGALALGGALLLAEQKMGRTVKVPMAALEVTRDPARIEHGAYLYRSRGCADCHGANGGGREVFSSGGMLVVGPNLTGGPNSAVRDYTVADWERTLRHGVKPSGRPVLIMPSEDYARLTDADTIDLIAYVRQLAPVDGLAAVVQLPLPVRVLYGAGAIKDAAAKIDHDAPPALPVAAMVSVQHGAYVANACIGCHGAQLSGGKIPGGPPHWPAAANLTPGRGSVMPRYADAEAFSRMMRSGLRPDGSAVDKAMPFEALAAMNDTDLHALYAYLKTTSPRAAGQH